MFSIILISHGQMSQGILHSSEMIFGKQEDVVAVSLNPDEGPDDFRKKLEEAIASLGNTEKILFKKKNQPPRLRRPAALIYQLAAKFNTFWPGSTPGFCTVRLPLVGRRRPTQTGSSLFPITLPKTSCVRT